MAHAACLTWSSSVGRKRLPDGEMNEVVMKVFMELKQAPRAWYDKLSAFLIKSGFTKGVVDPILFTRKAGKHLLLAKPTVMLLMSMTHEGVLLKEQVEREVVGCITWETKYQLAGHFMKALPRERFATLLPLLGVKQMSPETLKELQDESVSE
ncbi:hypothetical protein Tco_0508533 [Tanacetum coccineum]